MNSSFTQNILLLIVLNLLIKPLYLLGIDVQVQNIVGTNEYGTYFTLFAFCFLFQFILDFGLQNYSSTLLSKDREKASLIFPVVVSTKVMLSALFAGLILLASMLLQYDSNAKQVLYWVIGAQILQSFFIYIRSHYSIMGKYRIDGLLSVLDKLMLIFFLGYFIYIEKSSFDIIFFAKCYFWSLFITVLISTTLLKLSFSFVRMQFSIKQSLSHIKKSIPFGLVFLFMTLYIRMDGFMLGQLLDDDNYSAGVYAASYRIYDAFNILGYLFAGLLLPMFAYMLGQKSRVNNLIRLSRDLLFSISSLLAILCVAYSKEIMESLYVDANEMYVQSFSVLMISFVLFSMGYIYGTVITAGGKLKKLNYILILGIVINWSLNLILIPKYFAVGAAFATLITQTAVVLCQIILASQLFELDFNGKKVALLGLGTGLSILVIFSLKSYLAFNWIYILIISAIICAFIPFIIKIFRFGEIRDFILNKSEA